MKLKKLIIHNIASIADATIDFDAEPLANSEVFLITGRTGAGKSTILDSICLALYNSTPRLKSAQRLESDDDDLKSNDVRQLMRRFSAEASVTLHFVGNDGVNYVALWSVARKVRKSDGSLQVSKWEVRNADSGAEPIRRRGDVESLIAKVVGLDFAQFCRTTLLAQGEFTQFLNSKEEEKAKILEKITGVDVYSRIGVKIYKIATDKKREFEDAQRLIDQVKVLSDEEIGLLKTELESLDSNLLALQKSRALTDAKLSWLKRNSELDAEFQKVEMANKLAQEALSAESFVALCRQVDDWQVSDASRKNWTDNTSAVISLNTQNGILGSLSSDCCKILGGLDSAHSMADGLKASHARLVALITKLAHRSSVYANSQTVVANLNNVVAYQSEIRVCSERILAAKSRLSGPLMADSKALSDSLCKYKDSLKMKESELLEAETSLTKLDLPGLRKKLESLKDRRSKISVAREAFDVLCNARKALEQRRSSIEALHQSILGKQNEASSLAAGLHDAKVKWDTLRDSFEKQKQSVDKFAMTMRALLHVGDVCPVCQQKVSSDLPHDDQLQALVANAKDDCAKAEKVFRDLDEKMKRLNAEIVALSDAFKRESDNLSADNSVELAVRKVDERCKACGLNSCNAEDVDALASETDAAIVRLQKAISSADVVERRVKSLLAERDSARKLADDAQSAFDVKEKEINKLKSAIESDCAVVSSKQNDVESARAVVSQVVDSVADWTIDWHVSPAEFASSLATEAKSFADYNLELDNVNRRIEKSDDFFAHADEVLSAVFDAMPAWRDLQHLQSQPPSKETLDAFCSSVSSAIAELNRAKNIIDSTNASLNAFFAAHPDISQERLAMLSALSADKISTLRGSIQMVRDKATTQKSLLGDVSMRRASHLNLKPDFDPADSIGSLQSDLMKIDKSITDACQRKGAICQELKSDADNRGRLGGLQDKARQKKALSDKWELLNAHFGSADGKKFMKVAQSYILINLINAANVYMRSLTDRYQLVVVPGSFSILIEDAYQGFARRPSSTISGGESFLVSLALALALSDIGNRLSVDTLFIDEGFGSLSGEPLQNAIATLHSLHSRTGRHVGIISHVDELRERIPVQIQVVQSPHDSCSKISVVH